MQVELQDRRLVLQTRRLLLLQDEIDGATDSTCACASPASRQRAHTRTKASFTIVCMCAETLHKWTIRGADDFRRRGASSSTRGPCCRLLQGWDGAAAQD